MSSRTPLLGHHREPAAGDLLADARARLRNHRLYRAIRTPAALRTFVEHHVVCVLDFMSLLKGLQRDLTCVSVPWTPVPDPESARLINAIVLDEETDVREDGRVQSHFEWYLEGMEEIGADTGPARALACKLAQGLPWPEALLASNLPAASRAFGMATASFLARPLLVRAAVFFHGREEVIPGIFLPVLEGLDRKGLACESLRAYLARHLEVDADQHGPLAGRVLARLHEGDPHLRAEAEMAARESLLARLRLWDAIALAALDAATG